MIPTTPDILLIVLDHGERAFLLAQLQEEG